MNDKGEGLPQQYKFPMVLHWNIDDDYYKDGINLYADGLLEINVGGMVYGRNIRRWFESQKELDSLQSENARLREEVSQKNRDETERENLKLAHEIQQLRRTKI